MRECNKCKVLKSLENYNKYSGKSRRKNICKPCESEWVKNWAKNNPERAARNIRNSRLKGKYGISLDQYENMEKSQNKKCLICEEETKRNLAVDHCHETGKVRGLLCMNCNTGLGHFKDNKELLERALKYLLSFR